MGHSLKATLAGQIAAVNSEEQQAAAKQKERSLRYLRLKEAAKTAADFLVNAGEPESYRAWAAALLEFWDATENASQAHVWLQWAGDCLESSDPRQQLAGYVLTAIAKRNVAEAAELLLQARESQSLSFARRTIELLEERLCGDPEPSKIRAALTARRQQQTESLTAAERVRIADRELRRTVQTLCEVDSPRSLFFDGASPAVAARRLLAQVAGPLRLINRLDRLDRVISDLEAGTLNPPNIVPELRTLLLRTLIGLRDQAEGKIAEQVSIVVDSGYGAEFRADLAWAIGEVLAVPEQSESSGKPGPQSTTANGNSEKRSADRRTKKPSVNARMVDTIQSNNEAEGWTSTQWARHLKCSKSTIVDTSTWKALENRRLTILSERQLDRRGRNIPRRSRRTAAD